MFSLGWYWSQMVRTLFYGNVKKSPNQMDIVQYSIGRKSDLHHDFKKVVLFFCVNKPRLKKAK
jgi:hypothetical protein